MSSRWLFHEHTTGWWAYPKAPDGTVDFAREEPLGPHTTRKDAEHAALRADHTAAHPWADETWIVHGGDSKTSTRVTIFTGDHEQPCTLIYVGAYNGNAYYSARRACACVNALEGLDPDNERVKTALDALRGELKR